MAAPPEIIELSLMEKFGWTPREIDEIPFGKMQRLFTVMEQRESSIENAQQAKAHNKPKKKQH